LVEPTSGKVFLEGDEITGAGPKALRSIRSSKLGMVFQHFALLPHLSVLDNVAFGLRVAGVSKQMRRDRAAETLQLVGLERWGERKPGDLSGGMRQRVGLARALVMDTPVLLMDEPFSALDPLIREEMQQELLRLQANLNKSIVFVTHDPNEAVTLGDHIAILYKGQVVQEGAPLNIVLSPTNDYVKKFVRGVSVFKVMTASQVVDASVPPVYFGRYGAELSSADQKGASDGIAVIDDERRPVGILNSQSAARLSAVISSSAWKDCVSQEFVSLSGRTLIAPFLGDISGGRRAVFVVDGDGRYLGMVTGRSMLRALSAIPLGPSEGSASSSTEAPMNARE
jgi:glycine betaine/proline transport system ATP-binding protein